MTSATDLQTLSLGPDGPVVPALGIGTWAWGDSLFWDYGKTYSRTDLEGAFTAALAAGLTLFDTAEVYGLGESERLVGQFMAETEQPVVVATKYFPLPWRVNQQAVSDALTASLERLQTDTIALYQIHWPLDFLLGQRGLMAALALAVRQGRVQAVGVSNYSAQQMRTAHQYLATHGVPLAVNQVQYSLLHRNIETNGVLATAQDLGVTVLAYSPLAQGLLSGKYRPDAGLQPTGARRLNPQFKAQGLTRLIPLLDALNRIGEHHDRTPAQVALNWLVLQGVLPIPGAKNARQASQNAGALGWAMTAEEQAELDRLTQRRGAR